ncbi:MAG: hypothetical protein IPN17_37880 [Deltaproteobacteria bacterium]|nr:hypothetical protein [Deltaproteobacteria bacterium]
MGGNLWKQLTERRTLDRIARNLRKGPSALLRWDERYFDNFTKVPEAAWSGVLSDPRVLSRCTRSNRGSPWPTPGWCASPSSRAST